MNDLKEKFVQEVVSDCAEIFSPENLYQLQNILAKHLYSYELQEMTMALSTEVFKDTDWYIRQFLAIKTVKGLSGQSLNYYNLSIRMFFNIVDKPVPLIQLNDIRYFVALKTSEQLKKTTINGYIRTLKSFFTTLFDEGMIENNPTKRLEQIKQEKHQKKPFNEEEIEKLRNHFKNSPRERALIEFMLSTGCRVGEIVAANRDDIKGNKLIVTGKGNKQRTVYLTAAAQFALNAYLETRSDDNNALFVCERYNSKHKIERMTKGRIEAIMRLEGRAIGIENCHPHRFRRTMATNALHRGMPIEQVSLMLGHDSIDTTQIYARSEERDIEAAHGKYVF